MRLKGALVLFSLGLLGVGCGGGGSSGNVNIRTVNFVHGSSSVNVNAQSELLGTALVYGTPTSFNSIINFPQTISATDTVTSTPLGLLNLIATNGDFYTLYVYGAENGTPAPTVNLLQDAPPAVSVVATSVRVGNFSTTVPGSANVDVYITPTTAQSLTGLTPQFSNVAFGTVASYTQMSGQGYTVWITVTNAPTQVLWHQNEQFNNANAYSIYVDDGAANGSAPAGDVVSDTF